METTEKSLSPSDAQALANYNAYMQNSVRMQEIVAAMKEIPTLPSEVPKDVNALQKVEFPPDGGVLTYMDNFKYPYKGFPFYEFVDKIDVIKKIQRAVLSSLYHSLRARHWYQLMFLVTVPWVFNDILRSFVYTFFRTIDRFKIKPVRYCTAIRELHRAFSISFYEESKESIEMRGMIRDLMCMILEFDNAYRYRFQDIMPSLDKERLQKNPSKELSRMFALLASREKTQEIKDTWKLVRYFLPWYVRFNSAFRKTLIAILVNLDLEKVSLTVEDRCFCEKRKDYAFEFMK